MLFRVVFRSTVSAEGIAAALIAIKWRKIHPKLSNSSRCYRWSAQRSYAECDTVIGFVCSSVGRSVCLSVSHTLVMYWWWMNSSSSNWRWMIAERCVRRVHKTAHAAVARRIDSSPKLACRCRKWRTIHRVSKKTSHLWLAITVTWTNFWYFWQKCYQ